MSIEIAATTFQMPDGSQEVELTHDRQTQRFAAEGLSPVRSLRGLSV
jgi:hypothetical protein